MTEIETLRAALARAEENVAAQAVMLAYYIDGPDCNKCERRGIIRRLPQETYCDRCRWGNNNALNYFKEAANVQR